MLDQHHLTDTMKAGNVMIHLPAPLLGAASVLPHRLNLNNFLSDFLCQASWFRPVWSKLEAITSGSGEITSLRCMLGLIFHNTADSFKVLTETLNTKASVTDERLFGTKASLKLTEKTIL